MAKKNENDFEDIDELDKEKKGGSILTTLFVIGIIVVWLAIFALAIKLDFGGLGSNVLRPVLKDVPVINKILPAASDSEFFEENNYPYKTLESAVARIKELELELADYKNQDGSNSEVISDLRAEIERLKVFEDNQDAFEERVKEFDENVVFNDNAPDITEYEAYYAQISPENAEEIYRQVVEQIEYDKKIQVQADRYAKMEPADAAKVLEIMTADDLDLVCGIFASMKDNQAALIMAELDPPTAAKITQKLTLKEER